MKYKAPAMNTLQTAQFQDLIKSGLKTKHSVPREANKGFSDTPLFNQTQQTKLF